MLQSPKMMMVWYKEKMMMMIMMMVLAQVARSLRTSLHTGSDLVPANDANNPKNDRKRQEIA